jgi:predicted amidophosphoribosyltransferase
MGGCDCCGLSQTLSGNGTCLPCEQDDGPLSRIRAGFGYGEVARSIAMRLKYGRKIALARTMAAMMKRSLHGLDPEATLLPVPLHRWRLWRPGFNQSVLITRALARPMDCDLLRRVRATPRLKRVQSLAAAQNGRAGVRPAPGCGGGRTNIHPRGRVITTGATAEACAKVLRRAGARSVDLIAFARVLR